MNFNYTAVLTSPSSPCDFKIKMNTIFIITIIFIVIYNTWYDSYISQLFLLASKDTEKNSQSWKTIWSERNDLIDENL